MAIGMEPTAPPPGAMPALGLGVPPNPMSEPMVSPAPQEQKSRILREPPDIPESRRNGVSKLLAEIRLDEQHWEADFKQMREDMNFARGWQWPDQTSWEDTRYIANIVQRHINQRVAALYAKDPTFVARRRPRLDFQLWDGNPQSIMQAQQTMAMAQQVAQQDPMAVVAMPQQMQAVQQAQALMADVQQGMAKRKMYEGLARTLEMVFTYYVDEQIPPFKTQMKQQVRRALTCGVAWVKLGFQRVMEKKPEVVEGLADAASRMAHLERLTADLTDDKFDETSSEMEELRKTMEALQAEPDVLLREGLTIDYPQAWNVIPDRKCRQLKGFVGCDRVTQKYMLTPDQVKEIYGVDLGGHFTAYRYNRVKLEAMGMRANDETLVAVYEAYERKSATVCTVAEGWPDYLRAPVSPAPWLERFWPFFCLSFNDGEHESKVYPQSDVFLLRSEQREYNRCREGLRRHRIANRPKTIASAGVLSEEDEENLKTHPDNAVIEVQGLQPGQKVTDLLQPWQGPPIDPALYNTDTIFQDVLRIVGSQEANMGGTSNSTATESSIAESSRLSSLQSNIDDLDDFLSEVADSGSGVLLLNVNVETVNEIVGPGAVWPNVTKNEVANEFYLEVQAGSSGRPNKAQEMQNMNLVMPYLLQIPGINPTWLAEQALKRMDDRMDLSDAISTGLPSITAMNTIKQPESAAGPEEGQEGAEGAQGADNAPKPGQGAQANATPTIPHTRPAVGLPPNVAGRGAA